MERHGVFEIYRDNLRQNDRANCLVVLDTIKKAAIMEKRSDRVRDATSADRGHCEALLRIE